jgi:hypothetical protein
MPAYLYQMPDGSIREVVMSVAEMCRKQKNGRITIDGKRAKRRVDLEHGGFQDVAAKNWNPGRKQDNWAVSCDPSQIPEYAAAAKARGVPTEFSRSGSPQFTSLSHRRKYLKAFGKRDWSDYQ